MRICILSAVTTVSFFFFIPFPLKKFRGARVFSGDRCSVEGSHLQKPGEAMN